MGSAGRMLYVRERASMGTLWDDPDFDSNVDSQSCGPEHLSEKETRRFKIAGPTRRTRLAEATKQGLRRLAETEAKITEPAWVQTRASALMLWLFGLAFL